MGVPTNQAKGENIKAANLLLSLSISNKIIEKSNNRRKIKKNGVFECKTCSREFTSFQALGGHCTSHLRPKVRRINGIHAKIGKKYNEPTKHICGLCGKEFPMGQALGGHMRLHRVSPPVTSAQLGQIQQEEEIDLSMLPTMKDEKLGFHIDEDVISESFEGRLLNLFV